MGGNDSSKLWTAIQDGDKTSIRKLLKKGIDPNSRSSYQYIQNVSVLMVASHKGYKEIVQLLLESGAKIHQTDSSGRTAIHWACEIGHGETVQLLLENMADVNIQDKYFGDTPLHLAAIEGRDHVVRTLIERRANPDIKNKAGKYPHDKTFGYLRQQLRTYWEEYRRAPLLKLGTVGSKRVKSYVVGSSKAGKTTFARAMAGLGDVSNVSDCTAGIDILEVCLDLEEVGHVTVKVHDVAGHDLFHTTHAFFFGGESALFEYIVDTDLSSDEILADAIYWLAFIISGRSRGGPPVYILILGSRGGDQHQMARQIKLDGVTRQLREKFIDHFIFILGNKSLVLDMRQTDSKAMEEVKTQLANGVHKCFQRVTNVPVICQEVREKVLSPLKEQMFSQSSGQSLGHFIEKADFRALVLKTFSSFEDSTLYSSLIYYLEEGGEIVDVGSRFVVNTLWLCRSLLAAVLASKADPNSVEFQIRMNAHADGTATLEEIAAVLEAFRQLNRTPAVDPKAGIDILCHMGLAFPTERTNVYRFPALIQDVKPEGVWVKSESTHDIMYVGIRLQCQSDLEIFSPAVMPLLQAEAANSLSEMAVIMWKGGMVVQKIFTTLQPKVEVLVSICDKRRAIRALDLVCRGPAHCHQVVKQFLDVIQNMTMSILDEKSPGTRVERRYLSHHQISQHIDRPISYSQEEVDAAKKCNGILVKETGQQIITEYIVDVLATNEDDIISNLQTIAEGASVNDVIRAVVKHGSYQWLEIGLLLGLAYATIKSTTHQIPNYPGKLRDIIERKRQQIGDEKLKRDLIQVCFQTDAPIGRAVMEELLKLQKSSEM